MSRNSTHINCNQIAGTVNQGIWKNDCDPCVESGYQIPNITQWLRHRFNVTGAGVVYAGPINTGDIANAAVIARWDDVIGTNHALQATTADKPVWNDADTNILFATSDNMDLTAVTYAVADDFVIVAGFIPTVAGTYTNHALWSGTGNDTVTITSATTIQIKLNNVAQTITGPTLAGQTGCEMINVTLRRSNGTCQFFVAGIAWGPSFIWSGDYRVDTIGYDGTNSLDGKIANFMQFDRALTDKEIWCLDCYLCGDDLEPEPAGCRIDEFKLACHGDTNGTLTANFTGAVAGSTITYLWSNSATTQTISSLGSGAYTCVLTSDNNTSGNAADDVVSTCVGNVVSPASALDCSIAKVDPYYATGGALVPGSVTLTTTGGWGTIGATYAWTVPSGAAAINTTTTSAAVTIAGTYSCTVTNIDGCTTTCSVVVVLDGPTTLDIECCIKEPLCHDDLVSWYVKLPANAVFPVTLAFTGSSSGVPSFASSGLAISSLPAVSTPACGTPTAGNWVIATGSQKLIPGQTWTIVATDSTSGTALTNTCTTTVTNPDEVVVTAVTIQPTKCWVIDGVSYSDGSINWTATGGTGTYTYSAQRTTAPTANFSNTSLLSSIAPGSYTLKAIDSNDCVATLVVVITCPMDPMPTITHTTTDVTCVSELLGSECDGTITFVPSVQTYTGYTFTLTVTDQGGAIIHTHGPLASFPASHVFGGSGGQMCQGNYTYDYIATETSSGTITTIAGATGFTITEPPYLHCNINSSQPPCSTQGGTATLTATGGTPSYTYAWTGPGGFTATTSVISSLTAAGSYVGTVTDANGCTCTDRVDMKPGCTFDVTLNSEGIGCSQAGSTTEYVVNGALSLNTMMQNSTAVDLDTDAQFVTGNGAVGSMFANNAYASSSTLFSSGVMDGLWMTFNNSTDPADEITQVAGVANNKLCFNKPSQEIIQRLDGLTIGSVTYTYTINVDAATFATGDTYTIKIYNDNGTAFVAQALLASATGIFTTAGSHSVTFNAVSANPIISIEYTGIVGSGSTDTWHRVNDLTNNMKMVGGYNSNNNNLMGKGVAISEDGKTYLIGSPGTYQTKGDVRTYKLCTSGSNTSYPYTGSSLNKVDTIQGDSAGDALGDREALSISHDGSKCVIGSPFEDLGGTNIGCFKAYAWTTTNASTCAGDWEQIGTTIYGSDADDLFGHAVAMSGDGTHIAVGSKAHDGVRGTVRVYYWNTSSNAWVQKGGDVDGESTSDNFGYSVGIADNGLTFVAGAPGDDAVGADAGHIRVYNYNGSAWVQKGADIDGEANEDFFGTSCDINGAGDKVIGGAEKNDGGATSSGHAKVYSYSGSAWVQLGADLDGPEGWAYSGAAVSLNTAGNVALVSAANTNTNELGAVASKAGSVRVYSLSGSTWSLIGLPVRGEDAGDYFGFDAMLNGAGTMFIVGAPFNDGDLMGTAIAGDSGAGYVYEKQTVGNGASGSGCITNVSVTGQVPATSTADIATVVNETCGLAPYTYAWTTPTATPQGALGTNSSTAADLIDVVAGTYQVVVTDANGCTDTASIIIAPGGVINNSITVVSNVSCSGVLGALESVDQSFAFYTWHTDAAYTMPVTGSSYGASTYQIDNQPAGTYYLGAIDANGCLWEGSATITGASSGMTLSAVITDADLCTDCCGAIDLSVSGGTAPYTYLWTGVGGPYYTEDISCADAGSYTVVVTDDDGCTETATYIVGVSNHPLNFTLQTNNAGGGTGTVSVIGLSGGTPLYNYQWTLNGVNVSAGSVSSVIPDLIPTANGLYCLTVTDSFLPTACSRSYCIDVDFVSEVLGYNCTQAAEDSCLLTAVVEIPGIVDDERSGYCHDLSGDGTTVIIGSPEYSPTTTGPANLKTSRQGAEAAESILMNNVAMSNQGCVRVYTYPGGVATQKGQTLFGDSAGASFGRGVSISTDGNKIVVGAPHHNNNTGYVRQYVFIGGQWVSKSFTEGTAADDLYGENVDITGAGLAFSVSAPGFNSQEGSVNTYSTNGFAWSGLGNQIVGSSFGGTTVNFLNDVAINDAADRLVIGAPTHGFVLGTVKAYLLVGSTWTQVGSKIDGEISGDEFGHNVACSADGLTIAVAATRISNPAPVAPASGLQTGAVKVYRASSTATSATWNQIGSTIYGERDYDGENTRSKAVDISADGNTIVMGAAPNSDFMDNAGQLRVFKLIDGSWVQQCSDIDGKQKGHERGTSVSISNDGARVSSGGPGRSIVPLINNGDVAITDLAIVSGSTAELITDGVDFTTLNSNAHTSAASGYDAHVIARTSPTNGQWYTFGPDGSSNQYAVAPTPTVSNGKFELTKGNGVVQRVTGLAVGSTYDITVATGPTNDPCVGQNVGALQVYIGSSAQTLTSPAGFSGNGFTFSCDGAKSIQYTATATTIDLVINSTSAAVTVCDWDVMNVSMKKSNYSCEECKSLPCDYATLVECQTAPCGGTTISESWNCTNGTCVDPGDGTGAFATEALCKASGCTIQRLSFNCGASGCYSVNGPGTYATLGACQTVCGISGQNVSKYYCEILCPDASDAERYKGDGEFDEANKERKRESQTGGGRCRPVTGSESPEIASNLQYDDEKTCQENCPWCKEGEERVERT